MNRRHESPSRTAERRLDASMVRSRDHSDAVGMQPKDPHQRATHRPTLDGDDLPTRYSPPPGLVVEHRPTLDGGEIPTRPSPDLRATHRPTLDGDDLPTRYSPPLGLVVTHRPTLDGDDIRTRYSPSRRIIRDLNLDEDAFRTRYSHNGPYPPSSIGDSDAVPLSTQTTQTARPNIYPSYAASSSSDPYLSRSHAARNNARYPTPSDARFPSDAGDVRPTLPKSHSAPTLGTSQSFRVYKPGSMSGASPSFVDCTAILDSCGYDGNRVHRKLLAELGIFEPRDGRIKLRIVATEEGVVPRGLEYYVEFAVWEREGASLLLGRDWIANRWEDGTFYDHPGSKRKCKCRQPRSQ